MSGSKESHDTEQHQNATSSASRVKSRIAAGLAFFAFSGTLIACSGGSSVNSDTQSTPVVPIKAMSAVFYEKSSDALPKIPTPPKPPHVTPPAPPAPTPPPAPPRRSPPPAPSWASPPPRPAPTQRRTYTYTPPESAQMPRDAIQSYARSLVGSSYEFTCIAHIIERESGWNPQAVNWSGAYGVPQALPGAKMSSAGSDWRTNPKTQLRWMVSYLNSRYGSACNAWGFWQSHGWY